MFTDKCAQVASVVKGWGFCPLHLYGQYFIFFFHDKIYFGSIGRPVAGECSGSLIGERAPQLTAYPVFEKSSGIGGHGINGERKARTGIANTIVEEKESGTRLGRPGL